MRLTGRRHNIPNCNPTGYRRGEFEPTNLHSHNAFIDPAFSG